MKRVAHGEPKINALPVSAGLSYAVRSVDPAKRVVGAILLRPDPRLGIQGFPA